MHNFFGKSYIYFESFILYTSTYLQKGFGVTFITHQEYKLPCDRECRPTHSITLSDAQSLPYAYTYVLPCTTCKHAVQTISPTYKLNQKHTIVMCDTSTTHSHQHLHSKKRQPPMLKVGDQSESSLSPLSSSSSSSSNSCITSPWYWSQDLRLYECSSQDPSG